MAGSLQIYYVNVGLITTHTCLVVFLGEGKKKLSDCNDPRQNEGNVGSRRDGWRRWRAQSLMGKGRRRKIGSAARGTP